MSDLGVAWPQGVARHVLDHVDSTNAEGLRRAPSLSGPAWIMALNQQAGRGRRGRAWSDPPGNFAASLVLHPNGPVADAARLSFVAALAVHDMVHDMCGPALNLSLKWPNDVLLNGGKLAGILLESTGSGIGMSALVVGVGINLVHAPDMADLEPDALRPVSLAEETGLLPDREEMLDMLAVRFANWHGLLREGGFAVIREAWLTRAARIGEVITARTGTTRTSGVFDGIDQTGALILIGANGRQVIQAADIRFGG